MKNKEYGLFFLKFLLPLLTTLSFMVIWYLFYSNEILIPFFRKGNWLVVLLYFFIYYVISSQMGAFNMGRVSRGDIIYSQILSCMIVNFFMYFVICVVGRFWMSALGIIVLTLIESVIIVAWAYLINHVHFKIHPPARAVFVCDGQADNELIAILDKHSLQVNIMGTLNIDEATADSFRALAGYDAIVLDKAVGTRNNELLKHCYAARQKIFVLPAISDVLLNGSHIVNVFDMPLFFCDSTGLPVGAHIAKRILDIVVSIVGIVIVSPIMLIVALLVKRDGGPAIYKQTRLTIDGKPFSLYKFRTMRVDAEADGVARLSSKTDDRVTSIGRRLRKIRLDELPQLLNILKGDLTLVGPRPERPELVAEYKKSLPEFDFRLRVKAGLTGYAQVMGKYSTMPANKLLLDLIYIENFSFWLDVKIFLMTIKTIFTPSSTD